MMLSGRLRARPILDPINSTSDSSSSLSSRELDERFIAITKNSGILCINGKTYTGVKSTDFTEICELGQGTCGRVTMCEYKHHSVAVKEMKRTDNQEEQKRLFTDLEVITKCNDCEQIVRCCGYILTADYLYIYMEVMATCLDKLLRHLSQRGRRGIPEAIISKITLSVVKALDYLKETHKIMHRDIKPSNILLDYYGNVKLCDFGICGKLIDSKATSISAGCVSYLAPERIQTESGSSIGYDVRADVWSLGITLLQLATGIYPYEYIRQMSHGQLELMLKIKHEPAPTLPNDGCFSTEFREFISYCLTKEMANRPKFKDLLETHFLIKAANSDVDVGSWYQMEYENSNGN